MKYQRILFSAGLAAALFCAAPAAVRANCGSCEAGEAHHHAEKNVKKVSEHHAGCPTSVKGAEVKVENTADGVVIRITAKDKKSVEKIQSQAAKHFGKKECPQCAALKCSGKCDLCAGKKTGEKAVYACPMSCDKSDKPGKCKKCGMKLKKK